MKKLAWLLILLMMFLLLTACSPIPSFPNEITPASVVSTEQVTPSRAPTVSRSPAMAPTATSQPAPETSSTVIVSSPTPTLNPVMATLEALKKQVTVAPSTPVGGRVVDPNDYVGLTEMACQIVKENYVRENFNGVNWDDVCRRYEEKAAQVKTREAFWELMTAMIAELHDDHSRFVPPNRFSLEFGLPSTEPGKPWPGMIVWPAREDPYLFIWDVCDVGGAHDAGLHRGDIILAIEGEEVVKGPDGFDEALIDKIYTGEGQVRLRVWQGPDETPRDVTVSYGGAAGCDGWGYGVVKEDPYIGYIRVPEYSPDADVNILSMIESLEKDRPLDGLIYDQRHNPGGFADKAIAIFTQGTFGKRGKLRKDATLSIWRVRGPVKWNETTPMVVLSDGASHSAAEYFAIAMKLSKRATLVGMPTAGNTEGITGFSLPDGSVIRLAVETLILPNGATMEGTGVEPDVRAPLGQWGLRQVPDVQLQKAIEVLTEMTP